MSAYESRYSPVAQSVEQQTVNLWVPGSSPGGGAKRSFERMTFFILNQFSSVKLNHKFSKKIKKPKE